MTEAPLRIATLAHGHPAVSPGGAEIAAHTLHAQLAGLVDVEALHVACVPPGRSVDATERTNCVLVETAALDPFTLLRRDPRLHRGLLDRLGAFRPDIVHFHHVLGFGADAIHAVRTAMPEAVIALTLHEFIPICHAQGQMVRTNGTLCHAASPSGCAQCFPERSPASFLIRARALRAQFAEIDAFIAPSAFLAERYRQWGLPDANLHVLENATRLAGGPPVTKEPGVRRNRFAFFGQINAFKGVDLLLEAVAQVPGEIWNDATLAINGSGLDRQPEPFQQKIAALLAATNGRAQLRGAYDNFDVDRLMAETDWVVVPSIWWENAPVVIQEAFRNARPVIAANLGGMAQSVHDMRDGLLFEARSPDALAAALISALDPGLWPRLTAGIVPPAPAGAVAEQHLSLFRQLRDRRRLAARAA